MIERHRKSCDMLRLNKLGVAYYLLPQTTVISWERSRRARGTTFSKLSRQAESSRQASEASKTKALAFDLMTLVPRMVIGGADPRVVRPGPYDATINQGRACVEGSPLPSLYSVAAGIVKSALYVAAAVLGLISGLGSFAVGCMVSLVSSVYGPLSRGYSLRSALSQTRYQLPAIIHDGANACMVAVGCSLEIADKGCEVLDIPKKLTDHGLNSLSKLIYGTA